MKQNSARGYKRRRLLIPAVLLLAFIIALISGCGDGRTDGGAASPAGTASPSSPPAPSVTGADLQLSSGHYTSGTDFPAGTYDITAVSGAGNVSSSNLLNGGINATMGTADANTASGADMYEQEYKNISLPEGAVLSVSGVVIRIASDDADSAPLKPREQANTETVELGSGNYAAGTDFSAGTYDIEAVSGGGNVYSDNLFSGGINAVMGADEANSGAGISFYERAYKNIELPEGTALTVDGVKIKLIPSK